MVPLNLPDEGPARLAAFGGGPSWIQGALNPWCSLPAVPSTGEAPYPSCGELQAVLLLARGSIHLSASFIVYFPLYLYCYIYYVNKYYQKSVVIGHDKAVISVGKCIQ